MDIVTSLHEAASTHSEQENRRLSARLPFVQPLQIQLLNKQRQSIQAATTGLSLDLSHGGVSFVCPITEPSEPAIAFALVQFQSVIGPHQPLLISVRYAQRVGDMVKIGGSFEVDWNAETS